MRQSRLWQITNISVQPDYLSKNKSSHLEVSYKKAAYKNLLKLTVNYLCQGLLYNKVAGSKHASLFKQRLQHRSFPVKFLRTPFCRIPTDCCLWKKRQNLVIGGFHYVIFCEKNFWFHNKNLVISEILFFASA